MFDRDPIRLADAYFQGKLDFEGDLYSAIALKTHFESLSLSWRDKLALLRDARHLPARTGDELGWTDALRQRIADRFTRQHSKERDRAAISFHYDGSNEFYRP